MYCPHCGTDAAEAKFCPECGADLNAVRAAKDAAGPAAPPGPGGPGGDGAPPPARPATGPSRGPSARLLWIVVAVVAAAVVGVVLLTQLGAGDADDGATTAHEDAGNGAVTAVEADTSGGYAELVERANGLFDQGDTLFQQSQIDQGAQYFAAAAAVYAAAWEKKPGDPNVGTDWATALFYSGDMQGAVERIEVVLQKDPEFQTAWFNKGNYLAHLARMSEQMGVAKDAKRQYEQARQAYVKAAALDPASEVGKEADRRLQDLPD